MSARIPDALYADMALAGAACLKQNLGGGTTAIPEHMAQWAVGAGVRLLEDRLAGKRHPPEYYATPAPKVEAPKVEAPAKPPPTIELGGEPNAMVKKAVASGFSGNMCQTCGSFDMVRTGTCETCQGCGGTSGGCS